MFWMFSKTFMWTFNWGGGDFHKQGLFRCAEGLVGSVTAVISCYSVIAGGVKEQVN